jgi:hypothetical protein
MWYEQHELFLLTHSSHFLKNHNPKMGKTCLRIISFIVRKCFLIDIEIMMVKNIQTC